MGGRLGVAGALFRLGSFTVLLHAAAAQGAPLEEPAEEVTPPEAEFPPISETSVPHDAPAAPVPEPATAAPPSPQGLPHEVKPAWGEILNAVAPAIAKVGCDEDWYSGFLIRPDLVATTLAVATRDCDAEARVGNDDRVAVEVVAWSEKDRVAIVRLAKKASAPPLRPHRPERVHQVGEEVAVVASWVDDALSLRGGAKWRAPRVRFARVGVINPTLALDRDPDWMTAGAPVLSSSGEVIGMVQAGGAPTVVPWSVLNRLADSAGQQGSFSQPWDVGMFSGVMFSVRPQPGTVLPIGVRLDWLALQGGLDFGWAARPRGREIA